MFNLLKLLGLKPEKVKFCFAFGRLSATDLTEDEVNSMHVAARCMAEKKVEPIAGYICEHKKGSYFIPTHGGMIMKIDCKNPDHQSVRTGDVDYTLEFGYKPTVSEDRKKTIEEINKNSWNHLMFEAAKKIAEDYCEPKKDHFADKAYSDAMAKFVNEFKNYGIVDDYKSKGISAVVKSINKFIDEKKTEILLAWWAKYGFEPGRAVLVEQKTPGGLNIFIREEFDGELVMGYEKPTVEVAIGGGGL